MSDSAKPWTKALLKRRVRFAYGSALAADERNEGHVPVYGSNGVVGEHDFPITKAPAIVIGRKGSSGKLTWSNVPCFPIDTTYFLDETQTREDIRWLLYALGNLDLDKINFDSAVPGLSREYAYSLELLFPPIAEQQRIATYLDASCAAIDAAVGAKRKQIETLDALEMSLIHDAVTRGLTDTAPMSETRLDWNKEAPTHWRVRHIKRMCSLVRGQFTHRPRNDPALYDGPYPFIQTGDITAAQKYIRTYGQTLNELGLAASKQFPKGTLVMSIAANIGDVAILDFEACFPDSMVGLIPSHETDLHFLYYLMRAMRPIMLRSAVLSTQLNLNYVRIGTNFAAFPPTAEQVKIAAYLDAKEREVQSIKSALQRQIDTLTAYRKSLIHECVTGQRRISAEDLAGVGARLPEAEACA